MSDPGELLRSRQGEEHLKMMAFGGVARSRSAGAFTSVTSESNTALRQYLQRDVFQPSLEEV